MAVTVEELRAVMRMEMKPFMRDLQQMNGVSSKAARQVENTWRQANRRLDGIGKNMARSLIAPMAGIGAALGARELIRLTDTWTDLNSRVRLAAGGVEQGNDVMERLGEVARRTYSSLEQTAEGYLANATALKELGYSTTQTLDYTEALNNALVVSGAKGERAATVTDALAKAMALGKLSGVNLNTVIAQGGRVAEALAAGLGTTVGGLRSLGAQGKITGRDIVTALSSQMEKLRKEAEDMPATISDGIQLLQNAMLEYVGNADQATGISAKISEALVIMADNFDKTADVALQLAGVIAGALIGRSLLKMISTLGLAGKALHDFTRALAAARTMGGLAAAFGGLSAAAGPVGLLIGGAVVTSLIAYSSATADATAASRTYEEALEAVRAKAGEVADAVDEAAGKIDAKTENMLSRGVDHGVSEIARLRSEILSLMEQYDLLSIRRVVEPDQLRQIDEFREKFDDGTESVQDLENRLFALANASPDMQMLAERLSPLLMALREAIAATDILQQKLGAPDRATIEAYQQYGASRVAGRAVEESSAAYIREAERRAKLGKDQLALETEIARVREQSLKDGEMLTEAQIKQIAKINLAGNKTRSEEGKKPKKEREDEYARLTTRIKEQTAALIAETAAQAGVNPLVDDYGRAATEAAMAQDILTAAKKAGTAGASEFNDIQQLLKGDLEQMSPAARELAENIRLLVGGYADADVAAKRLTESQDKLKKTAEEFRDFGKDMMSGFISDLRQGKSAAEALENALGKVVDKLLDMALSSLFSGFNPLKLFGLKDGGPVRGYAGGGKVRGRGGPRDDKILARLSNGEFVVNAKATAQNRDLLEAINSGRMPRLADGGLVSGMPSMPRLPTPANHSKSGSTYAPVYHIDARGADAAAIARLEAGLKERDKKFGSMVDARTDRRNARRDRA